MSATTTTTTTTTAAATPTVAVGAAPATSARIPVPLAIAAGASVFAGLLHYAVVPEHRSEWIVYGVFFTLLGAFQLIWAAGIWATRCNRLLTVGAVVNLAVLVLWIVTRTAGLPFGPEAGEAEAVGVFDVLCGLAELVIVAAAAKVLLGAVAQRKRA